MTPDHMPPAGSPSRVAGSAGRATVSGILTILIVAAGVYIGMKMIPVRARAFQFDDAVQQQALAASAQLRQPTSMEIRARLMTRARQLGLPLHDRDLRVEVRGTSHLTIEAEYVVPIEFIGGYVYAWRFRSAYDGPLTR